ncbi:type II CAAX endopeptidase family protein [Nonomuraea sp. NPDC050404]|uniref:type II CAAX endopeptidase family protein n=1 Tax=Nonomuraea sp. NPDC050404 TaxID=3155783 RepID=UPI0034101269
MTSSAGSHRQKGGPPGGEAEAARPGWFEIGAAAVAYLVLFGVTATVLRLIPAEDSVGRGLAGYALSALIGVGAFVAAFAVRIREVRPFGVRRAGWKWLLLGTVIGAAAWWLNIVVTIVYAAVTGDAGSPQGDYQAAGGAGVVALSATFLLGAVATPIGEELAFRGVLANALNRYGWWADVLVSSAVFAVAHGLNPVLPVAFVIGVLCAVLFRRTGSIWPGVCVHAANNASSIVMPLLLAPLLPG